MRTRHRATGFRRRTGAGRGGHRGRLLLILAAALTVLILLELSLNPLVDSSIAQQAQKCTAETVNRAVDEWLTAHSTDGFTRITRSADGGVQSVEADAAQISSAQAQLNLLIQQRMADQPAAEIRVPLGTLLGWNLLRELGPRVTTRFAFSSSVLCKLENKFSSAGINQTVHEVWLTVTASAYAMIPTRCRQVDTSVSFCIAQTVIVGNVPSVSINR